LLSKLIPKTSKYHYRLVLIMLFVAVGFIISTISIVVSGYYQLNTIHKEFDVSAKRTLAYKKDFIHTQTDNFRNYLRAVDRTIEFERFIQSNPTDSTQEKKQITSIMMAIAHSDSNIMQFRFLGKHGCEAIRIDRDSIADSPYQVDEKDLQNKADRYYFKDVKKMTKGTIWFSKIDLNMERGEIVQPIKPTLRIAKPYYFNDEFRGMLIINIFMEKILEEVMESELFHVAIIDKDAHILTNNLRGYKENHGEWTRYLNSAKDVRYATDQDEYTFLFNLFFQKQHSNIELSDIIKNDEGLKILLEEKTEKLMEYTKDIVDYMIVMSLIILLVSLPIAIILSRYPLRLHDELKIFKDELEEQLKIIDKYVYMTSTDLDGNITDISTAYTKLSGYSKDELIGENHRILKDPNTPDSFYKKMWLTILNGKSWSGEIRNIRKNGEVFCIIAHISPILDDGNIVGYTSIRENITDQKLIEEISIKDELTGAYNRRFFNQIFTKELKRARRKGDIFSIAMLDIDYFKKYNDTYGHIKGDEALQKVVKQVSRRLQRAGDYLFRVGGEEFIIICSGMKNFEEAKTFSSKIVKSVEDIGLEHKTSEVSDFVTISLGLLVLTLSCSMDEDTVLKRIDELLYSAKEGGRNQAISQSC
jgi:diguanylate cyclase (GGDEF)-like protein/PAS domain S-box-containing protein